MLCLLDNLPNLNLVLWVLSICSVRTEFEYLVIISLFEGALSV